MLCNRFRSTLLKPVRSFSGVPNALNRPTKYQWTLYKDEAAISIDFIPNEGKKKGCLLFSFAQPLPSQPDITTKRFDWATKKSVALSMVDCGNFLTHQFQNGPFLLQRFSAPSSETDVKQRRVFEVSGDSKNFLITLQSENPTSLSATSISATPGELEIIKEFMRLTIQKLLVV